MITLISYICFGWVFYQLSTYAITNYAPKYTKYLCAKCFTFWFTLVITFDPLLAATVSFGNFLIENYLNKISL